MVLPSRAAGWIQMANDIDLRHRSAIVTGGAQGFGKAIAQRFVHSGARVALWDRDIALAQQTAAALGPAATAIACDVTEPSAVGEAVGATVGALGKIEILVNNAGIAGATATTWETALEEWRNVM